MCRKLIYLISVMVLTLCLASSAPAANIIWVTKTQDHDIDGIQDDQAWIDWLTAEGHTVDVRLDYWLELDLEPNKVDELNAADLVIISRSCSSGDHDEGDEPALWNSVTSPLITLNAYLVRTSRWLWMNTGSHENGDAILMASDTSHPVFDGVTFEGDNMVIFFDNTVGTGLSTFPLGTDVGNGTLIAQALGADWACIAEWAAGVEFYEGSGQTAGGRRMLFAAGSQEDDGPPATAQGAWNLTAEGEKMFRNAINYMLPEPAGANIIWVSKTQDSDADGLQDDQGFIDLLTAEGHNVDVRLDYWGELDLEPAKVDELNAADLVIVSRSTSSGDHDEGDEPALWNSVTAPMIQVSTYLVRTNRWLWMDTSDVNQVDAILMALDTSHPVFDGVTFEGGNMVIAYDNTVSGGLTTFPATIDVGNGTLIAQTLGIDCAAIVEWDGGVEMYPGGAIAGGPRMLFAAGSHEQDAAGVDVGPQGGYNLTADGEKMFLNAISYMVSAGP